MRAVSVAQTKGEWNDIAATCFIPADYQILTLDNLMHTIPFALSGIPSNQTPQPTSEKAKPSRKRQWAVFGRSGIAAEQNDCVQVKKKAELKLGFHVLSNHFFP